MTVFEELDRTDPSPAGHAETQWQFLNRVSGPFWDAVRGKTEEWFANFCAESQNDLRSRLRSPDSRQFNAAFWELFLHESLLRAGYRVTCHPELPGTGRRLDFLVEGDGGDFYLEATVASDPDDKVTADRRRARVYQSLDRIESPNFYLWVDVNGEGGADLATRPLRSGLERWLASLDADELTDQLVESEDIRSLPSFEWETQDWQLVFRPWPKAPEHRGNDGARPLGVFGEGNAQVIDDGRPLRRALDDKGTAYGALDLPYVVAIRTSSISTDDFDVMNVLYGSSQVQFGRSADGTTVTREVRAPDGYWYDGTGDWAHRGVSAVLISHNVSPWSVTGEAPELWEHPAPERPVVAPQIWNRAVPGDSQLKKLPAEVSSATNLGLPAEWPPGDAFPGE
ncbi:MAG TPA: hypothetical protein VMZ22_07670 [Acidimicrobiales bacterium]|nr:hypothetical protein [Acidimicrobiales bacterium]